MSHIVLRLKQGHERKQSLWLSKCSFLESTSQLHVELIYSRVIKRLTSSYFRPEGVKKTFTITWRAKKEEWLYMRASRRKQNFSKDSCVALTTFFLSIQLKELYVSSFPSPNEFLVFFIDIMNLIQQNIWYSAALAFWSFIKYALLLNSI